jgi:hypothetical protein
MLQYNNTVSFTLTYIILVHVPLLCDEMKGVTLQKIWIYTNSFSLSIYVSDIIKLT